MEMCEKRCLEEGERSQWIVRMSFSARDSTMNFEVMGDAKKRLWVDVHVQNLVMVLSVKALTFFVLQK
jgi:hypothetical protein